MEHNLPRAPMSRAEINASPLSVAAPVISPPLRKKLQQCYEHGTKLMQLEEYDFDYAHSLLVECVAQDPGNAVYVEAFLLNLQKKFNNNKRGALLAFGGKGTFKKALAKKNWLEALKHGPEILKSNPWDVATLRGMAEACAVLGFSEVERRYLKNALAPNPNDPAVNKHCAETLARIGQFDQAIACWQRVDEAKRGDDEAQRMISELQIAKTAHRMGVATPADRRSMASKSSRPPTRTEQSIEPEEAPARREIELTPRQRLDQTLANNPSDIESAFELARLHIDDGRLAEASHVLTRVLAASGNNVKVQERIEDVEILRKKEQLAIAEKRAAAAPNESSLQLAAQLREDLNRIELEIFDHRAQRYPQDWEMKFQLGLRLKRVGNLREAMKCFELAQQSPARRAGAALELGECLQRQKHYDKALQSYRQAADDQTPEQREVRMVALYRLALLAEGLKNLDAAEQALDILVALDPQFKDAATRLDKLRTVRHKHA